MTLKEYNEQLNVILQNFAVCRDNVGEGTSFNVYMALCFDGRDESKEPIDDLFDKVRAAITQLNERACVEARIDELENIYEWGYPGAANSGIGTHLAYGDTKEIGVRIVQLKATQKGATNE